MIQRINRLCLFGIFRDFSGDAQSHVPVFKKRNLIYGWNYSGKTTISRLFQSLQFHERPLPYPTGSFTIQLSGTAEASEVNRLTQIPVRVFNRDYINANFQAEHTAPAVFIVGEENLALRARMEALRIAMEALRMREQERQAQINRITSADDSAGSARATAVGGLLGVRDFRRPDLETRIRQVRQNPRVYILDEDRRQAAVETFRSGEQFQEVAPLPASQQDLAAEIETVRALLARTATFDAIQGLRENRELQQWLGTGVGLHQNSRECFFCGGIIPEQRLQALQRHFSTAYQELLNAVDAAISRLNDLRFDAPRLTAMELLQEVRENARQNLNQFSVWLLHCGQIRQSLVERLREKRTALETPLNLEVDFSQLDGGNQILTRLNTSIQQHNERVQNMGPTRQAARVAIERHFAAVHFEEQGIAAHELQIVGLRNRIRNSARGRQRLERVSRQIAAQIDRAARGAERFKGLVNFLLRGSEIHVESRDESRFELMRGTAPADKLSDGEKTAIAFAYFVTSLEGDGEDVANTVVYIDDPISSLDSNHIYAVYALIQERLEHALQLFVSTHNSEFFNLLKARWLKDRDLRGDSEAFYVRRLANANGSYSQLESLPTQLRKYGSEYQFLFAQLHAFSINAAPTEFEAYAAPNLLRRFLEAYLGFKKPHIATWHQKLDLIFDSADVAREVHRICDDASHLQRLGRALEEPAFVASSQACVRNTLEGLRQKDPTHYDSMTAASA